MKISKKDFEAKIVLFTTALAVELEKNPDKVYDVEYKAEKKKRSLDANAYCWVLLGKLSEALQCPKEDIYKEKIRNVASVYDVVCVQDVAVKKLCEAWSKHGLGWVTDTMPSKIKGCTNVLLYYGSSTFDSKQMAAFIDDIVEDCKGLGIETRSPAEIKGMLQQWGENNV